MFKKLFFGGMAMLIAITAIFSATPALAASPMSGASPSAVLAGGDDPYPGSPIITVTKVLVMESYPPKLAISGTISNSCYAARASAPRVVYNANGQPRIVIGMVAVPLPTYSGSIIACAQAIRPYTVSVTLDRIKLKLPAGRYLLAVNPGYGVRPFTTTITLR